MENLLLLHGAIGSKQQLLPLENTLAPYYHIHSFNFYGHGGEAFPTESFSIPLFAEQVVCYVQSMELKQINIFGYSMGGYVALYIAKYYPELVIKIITLGTKFYWDSSTAEKEIKQLQPTIIEQ